MEGRAIARPDEVVSESGTVLAETLQWRAGQLPGLTARLGAMVQISKGPSMEGRAIARPDPPAVAQDLRADAPSMEGRAIARPDVDELADVMDVNIDLQWRAGQLPGLTRGSRPRCGPASCAFNGGPGNCPA